MSASNTRAEIVEVMARAIEQANSYDPIVCADVAYRALEASGRAVVPRLATDEMILAGEVARHGVPKATVCAVWDNMLSAALPPSKE